MRRRRLLVGLAGIAATYAVCHRERDPRIPDESSNWEVWYRDTFDRDAPATREGAGQGITGGLELLWHRTVTEAVNDSGHATFSRFSLYWGGHSGAEYAFIMVDPSDNPGLAKIRGWYSADLLPLLAGTHLRLLESSDRWDRDSIAPWKEADPILALAVTAHGRDDFARRLADL